MTNFPTTDQELFDKALELVRAGLLLTPHEFAQTIVDFVNNAKKGSKND